MQLVAYPELQCSQIRSPVLPPQDPKLQQETPKESVCRTLPRGRRDGDGYGNGKGSGDGMRMGMGWRWRWGWGCDGDGDGDGESGRGHSVGMAVSHVEIESIIRNKSP